VEFETCLEFVGDAGMEQLGAVVIQFRTVPAGIASVPSNPIYSFVLKPKKAH